MKKIFNMLLAAALLLNLSSCKKDSDDTPDTNNNNNNNTYPIPSNLKKIGETYITGTAAKAVVYAAEDLFVGFNTLYVAMYDSASGSRLTDGHLHFDPVMDMGMMQHGCPVETRESIDSTNMLFSSDVFFSMATMGTQGWTLNIGFHNHKNNLEGEGELPITVVAKTPVQLQSVLLPADDSARVIITFLKPLKPTVGLQDAEFTIHRKADDFDFPAVTDYSVVMTPFMPSMGHGSPNNVNPVHTINGHYVGKVNFTMNGAWEIQLKLYKGSTLLTDQLKFDVSF